MGVSTYTTVGPYIQIYNPCKKREEEYSACINKKCSAYKADKYGPFCGQCGKKVGMLHRPVKSRKEFDLEEILCDKSFLYDPFGSYGKPYGISDDYEILISSTFKSKIYCLGGDNQSLNDIPQNQREQDLKKFTKLYKDELKALKKEFGNKNVQVKWGVLVYGS